MSIAAEVQRVRDVFSPGADIRVPPFQRAYAWEDEETEVMIRDLLEAFRAGTVYFLGAIVVIRPRNRGADLAALATASAPASPAARISTGLKDRCGAAARRSTTSSPTTSPGPVRSVASKTQSRMSHLLNASTGDWTAPSSMNS